MAATPASERTVEAYLTYTVDTGIKPVTGTTGPNGKLSHRCGEFREHLMTVRDARPCRESLSLRHAPARKHRSANHCFLGKRVTDGSGWRGIVQWAALFYRQSGGRLMLGVGPGGSILVPCR